MNRPPPHDHAHPDPASSKDSGNERRVLQALLLTAGFMVVEAAGGLWSGSLALLADAAHMLTDAAALALAWLAFRVARRPADARRSYGYHRFQVLAAFINSFAMIALAGWIAVEAVLRLADPVQVLAGPMMIIAVVGLAVNLGSFALLHSGDRENLNMRGAALHVMGDILGSLAAIIAAVIIIYTGWMPADPILSLLSAGMILRGAVILVGRSAHILLEGTPEDFDGAALRRGLMDALPALEDVHHIHAWSLGDGNTLLTLHATTKPESDPELLLGRIKAVLLQRFGIRHATVQIETRACPDR
ncbi:MAG: cation diffusion facilitator family transporter [Alphaproteobacteria bacterium]|nr:cation diffusion facilitator family transporter [Alphaproteobacteria bacterium]